MERTFLNGQVVVASGGGGASLYVAKPAWQTGAGVPADSARDVPDVSFPSASHDGYYGCFALGGGDCANGYYEYFFGTSAASPSMAAVAALLNQKLGGSQGNINPLLYRVAASTPNAFHDATPASSGVTVCSVNTPSPCNNSTPSTSFLTGGLAGYALTAGYDQATGLGSLDVANFLNAVSGPNVKLASAALVVTGSASTISNTGTASFTATITSAIAGSPSGTVQFYSNGAALGAPIPVVAGVASTTAIPFPQAGSYFISASYSGDSTYASTIASGFPLTVTGLSSVTKITIANPSIPVGTSATFNVSVAQGSGSTIPTGVIRFYVSSASGSGYAAAVPLSAGSATSPPIPFSAVGNYTITAYYLGDSVYSPSSSAALSVTVQKLTSQITLFNSLSTIGTGGAEIFSASIMSTVASTAPSPTGTLQLYSNGTALGAPLTLPAGLAIFPVHTFSTPGTYTITAAYSGDAYWQPSTASGQTITVSTAPASYQTSINIPGIGVAVGSNVSTTVMVQGSLGFTGTVSLSCSVAYGGTGTATDIPTCSLSPSTLTLTPSSVYVPASLSVATTPRTVKAPNDGLGRSDWRRGGGYALCGLVLCLWPLRRRQWRSIGLWVVLVAAFMTFSGCGGSNASTNSSTPTGPDPAGTTPGSYTVTVTASSSAAGSTAPAPVSVALTVQ
jgi:hypothetical protein